MGSQGTLAVHFGEIIKTDLVLIHILCFVEWAIAVIVDAVVIDAIVAWVDFDDFRNQNFVRNEECFKT